jgi:hypothetical protein
LRLHQLTVSRNSECDFDSVVLNSSQLLNSLPLLSGSHPVNICGDIGTRANFSSAPCKNFSYVCQQYYSSQGSLGLGPIFVALTLYQLRIALLRPMINNMATHNFYDFFALFDLCNVKCLSITYCAQHCGQSLRNSHT